ncbi:NeuD/PglB/VioB family sugar acetyltransferase [Ekhidna sp. To15]|uniref:NeuD/PglB/VioB family sugar acetyltransferase n=1 Tax=Ekhidna sp. To15 TaxID=3395267 RepID=UPI003F524304
MKKLAIIGAGDLGQQIAYHASKCGYEVVGFFDDYSNEVLGKIEDVKTAFENKTFDELMIGIGYKHMDVRSRLYDELSKTIPFGTVINPSAYIDPSCQIGAGTFIYPGCVLDMNVVIGDNVSLNAGCVIAHDSTIESHSMLSPGVVISGFVTIEQKVNLGTGTKVIDNIRVSSGVRTGAGAVVTDMLEKAGLYVGIPATFKKL